MVSSGVERIRVAVSWGDVRPYPAWSSVPASRRSEFETDGVDRVPTRFAQLDALVGAAAARGLTVLPTVLAAPVWDGWLRKSAVVYAPRSNRPYGNFLRALVRRYGPRGTFWRHGPRKLPIRAWQSGTSPTSSVCGRTSHSPPATSRCCDRSCRDQGGRPAGQDRLGRPLRQLLMEVPGADLCRARGSAPVRRGGDSSVHPGATWRLALKPTANHFSCGSTRRACTSSLISRPNTRRCATRRTAGHP